MSGASPDAQAVDRDHPWLGLAAFTEETRAFFFGRGLEEDELYRRIRRDRTTLFFGQSGLGKTSLLQAGLLPRLREPPMEDEPGFIPVLVRLNFRADASSLLDQLQKLLADAVSKALPDAPILAPELTLWEYLHHRNSPFSPHHEQAPTIVLLFDQFEETFTLGLNSGEKRQTQEFLIALSDLIEDRCPASVKARLEQEPQLLEQYDFGHAQYRIVITIREDFLPQLETLRSRAPSLGRNRLRLTRMNGRQALEAVVGPGAEFIDWEAAEEIVRLVGRGRPDDPFGLAIEGVSPPLEDLDVEPSLLSLFCSELNERRLRQDRDRITSEEVIGSREAILQSFYERAFKGLPRRLRTFVERWLVSETGYRESMALDRAERVLGRRPGLRAGLDELVRRRLLHVEEKFEVPCIELTHDLLTEAVMRSRERRRLRIRAGKWIVPATIVIAVLLLTVGYLIIEQRSERLSAEHSDVRFLQGAAEKCVRGQEQGREDVACDFFKSVGPERLVKLDKDRLAALLPAMVYVAVGKGTKDPDGSLKMLTNAAVIAKALPEAGFDGAAILMFRADLERRLGRKQAAVQSYEEARAQFVGDLSLFSGMGEATAPRVEVLGRLGSINLGLATILPERRKALLEEAMRWQDERIQLARHLNSRAPSETKDLGAGTEVVALRLLVAALGDRAWTRVLSNRPREAIADADEAIKLAPGREQNWIRVNKGDALLLQGDLAAAMAIFDKVVAEEGTYGSHVCGDMADMVSVGLGSKQIEAVRRDLGCDAVRQ